MPGKQLVVPLRRRQLCPRDPLGRASPGPHPVEARLPRQAVHGQAVGGVRSESATGEKLFRKTNFIAMKTKLSFDRLKNMVRCWDVRDLVFNAQVNH